MLVLHTASFPDSSVGKESSCNAREPSWIPGSGSSPGEGIGCPLAFLGFPCGSAAKESTCNTGALGSIPGLGRSPGEGKGYALPYSGLENSMDCIVNGVMKSWTRLKQLSSVPPGKPLRCYWQLLLCSRVLLTRGLPKQPAHGLLCLPCSDSLDCYLL